MSSGVSMTEHLKMHVCLNLGRVMCDNVTILSGIATQLNVAFVCYI